MIKRLVAGVGNPADFSLRQWYCGAMDKLRQWLMDPAHQLGLIAGLVELMVSLVGRPFNLGRSKSQKVL